MENELRSELCKRILATLRHRRAEPGRHVPESAFASLGTSRGPIRSALEELARGGVLEHRPNRGYFVLDILAAATDALEPGREEQIYRSIGDDRLDGGLGETATVS
ncbi:GntR family transcriptional regulator [Aureimonas ureilytica]|uniref:GntR family transcriptional regulator n=1 Tax=Aureimonas ureilytica TaxID=401562 RepID=UPI000376F823